MSTRNTVVKAQAALKAEAKRRIKRVGTAARQLEEDLKWIANNKAWDLLGYENFFAMFKGENGYACTSEVWKVVAYGLMDEGMRERGSQEGHTIADVADMLGLKAGVTGRGARTSPAIQALSAQKKAGVSAEEATVSPTLWAQRKRGQNQDIGKTLDDRVYPAVGMKKELREWYRHEADTAVTPMPFSNLMAQVLEAHRDRVESERKANRRTSRSRGKAA